MIPGVSNRDARLLFELRVERMKASKGEKLGRELAEAHFLEIWRAGSLTGIDALIQDVLEMDKDKGRELMQAAIADAGWEKLSLNEELVAVFLRAESALFDAGVEGTISPTLTGIQFNFDTAHAAAGLNAIGPRVRALVEDHQKPRDDNDDKKHAKGDKKSYSKGGDKKPFYKGKKKPFSGKGGDKKRFGDKPRSKFKKGGKPNKGFGKKRD